MQKINSDFNDTWLLVNINSKAMSFVVYDRLIKKQREFYVPFLCEVRIQGYMSYITTTNNKVMTLNLITAKRGFKL